MVLLFEKTICCNVMIINYNELLAENPYKIFFH